MAQSLKKRVAGLFNKVHLPPRPQGEKNYFASLPRKRSSAGVIFVEDGKILIERLSYKPFVGLPGGVVDANESPLDAAVRECREELGLQVDIKRLLCVDYCHDDGVKGDTIGFVFLGARGTQPLRPDRKEVVGLEWVAPAEAIARLEPRASRRVAAAMKALQENRVIYCEDGVEPALPMSGRKPHGPAAKP